MIKKIFSSIIPYVLVFLGLIFTLYNYKIDLNIAFAAVLLFLSLFAERVYYIIREHENEVKFDSIKQSVDINLHNNFDTQTLDSAKVVNHLEDSIKHAKMIKNTYLPFEANLLPILIEERRVIDLYENFLKKPNVSWIDIVGINSFNSFRHNDIFPKGKELSSNHKLYVTKKNSAAVNFTIIYYEDRDTEVLFGWEAEIPIIRSSNEYIVSVFENYFGALAQHSCNYIESINYKLPASERILNSEYVDKEGAWGTITTIEGVPCSYGYLQIVVNNGRLEIGGIVSWQEPHHLEGVSNVFHHRKVSYTGDVIFLEFEGPSESGICVYKFRRDMADKEDKIYGYLINKDGKRQELYGVRLRSETKDEIADNGIRAALDNKSKFEEIIVLEKDLLLEGKIVTKKSKDKDKK